MEETSSAGSVGGLGDDNTKLRKSSVLVDSPDSGSSSGELL